MDTVRSIESENKFKVFWEISQKVSLLYKIIVFLRTNLISLENFFFFRHFLQYFFFIFSINISFSLRFHSGFEVFFLFS
jgi:hypothetical protein